MLSVTSAIFTSIYKSEYLLSYNVNLCNPFFYPNVSFTFKRCRSYH